MLKCSILVSRKKYWFCPPRLWTLPYTKNRS